MGDRALIQLRHGEEVSPILYLHWDGSDAYYLIRKAERVMAPRGPDLSYAFARLVGAACEHRPGCTSIGVWNADEPLTESDSHGDAGCLLVELTRSDWIVLPMGGYFGRECISSETAKAADRAAVERLDREEQEAEAKG